MAIHYPGYGDVPSRVEYEGCVLATGERNYHDDSDFYAVVWDEERQEVLEMEYATTRFGGGGNANVDATPEVKEKAEAFIKAWAVDLLGKEYTREAQRADVGKTVTFSPRGSEEVLEGVVGWKGKAVPPGKRNWDRAYQRFARDRIGVDVEGQRHFMDPYEATVVDWEQYLPSAETIEAKAEKVSKNYRAISQVRSSRMGLLVA